MKKATRRACEEPEMRAHYNFRGGVRGKYAARIPKFSVIVVLAPDVAEAFPTARAVNAALRKLMRSRATKRL